jgi:16S rRNA (cytosine1402-N4)-methyltransferase
VNDEMSELENFLSNAASILNIGGRVVVVTFHSLEDRIAKEYFVKNTSKKVAKSKYAHLSPNKKGEEEDGSIYRLIHKKPLTPTDAEVKRNIRSRSAKLRAAVKIAEAS